MPSTYAKTMNRKDSNDTNTVTQPQDCSSSRESVFVQFSAMAQAAVRSRTIFENEDYYQASKIERKCSADRHRLPQKSHTDNESIIVSNRILSGLTTSNIQAHGKLLEKKKKKKHERRTTLTQAATSNGIETLLVPREMCPRWKRKPNKEGTRRVSWNSLESVETASTIVGEVPNAHDDSSSTIIFHITEEKSNTNTNSKRKDVAIPPKHPPITEIPTEDSTNIDSSFYSAVATRVSSTEEKRSETKSFAVFLSKLRTNPMTTRCKQQQQWLCSLREPTIHNVHNDRMEMVFFEAIANNDA